MVYRPSRGERPVTLMAPERVYGKRRNALVGTIDDEPNGNQYVRDREPWSDRQWHPSKRRDDSTANTDTSGNRQSNVDDPRKLRPNRVRVVPLVRRCVFRPDPTHAFTRPIRDKSVKNRKTISGTNNHHGGRTQRTTVVSQRKKIGYKC